MASIDKKISAFDTGSVNTSSYFLQANNGTSSKVSAVQISDYAIITKLYEGLTTDDKTILGAINEIKTLGTGSFIVVQTLPVDHIDTKAIYLVPKPESQQRNIYDEYIYINYNWEKVGDTDIDLSGYITTAQLQSTVSILNAAINTKATLNDDSISSESTWSSDKIKSMFDLILPSNEVYGFHIDSSDTDPDDCISYLAMAKGMTPAHMDYDNDEFDWGGWQNAFFMPKPCFLKRDGTVDFYLDPDDYTKRANGTPSYLQYLLNIEQGSTSTKDYSANEYIVYSDTIYKVIGTIETGDTFLVGTNIELAANPPADVYGNAMMEWGQNGKKIWYKIAPDEGDNTSASIYVADAQIDNDYHCWSFYDKDNTVKDHFYTAIYDGTQDARGVLRSVSGGTPADISLDTKLSEDITMAELNNIGTAKNWYIDTYADWTIITILLVLMSKSLATEKTYGHGKAVSYGSQVDKIIQCGTLDAKGSFWGKGGLNEDKDGVKIFGMEHWWGNQCRKPIGLIEQLDNNRAITALYKLTRGTADGTTATDYNTDGTGYHTGGFCASAVSGIRKMQYNSDGSFQVVEAQASSNVSYSDMITYLLGISANMKLMYIRNLYSDATNGAAFMQNFEYTAASGEHLYAGNSLTYR